MAGYHVTLNGQGYVLDLRKYRKGVAETFARKQASGSRGYGDLVGPEEAWRQYLWNGGEGYLRYDAGNAARWRSGYGLDVTSDGGGGVRLGPYSVQQFSSGAGSSECTVGAVYGGLAWFGVDTPAFRSFNGTAVGVTAILGTGMAAGETPASMAVFLNKLYIGFSNGGGKVAMYDGAWLNPKFTVPSAPAGITTLVTHYREAAQYLYVVGNQGGTNGTTRVWYWDGATLSAGQYDFEEPYCLAAAVLGNRLWFFTSDIGSRRGVVYSLDDSGAGGVYRKHEVLEGNYFTCAATYGDGVYLGCGRDGAIYRWDGATLRKVYQLGTRDTPYGVEMNGAAVWDGSLWFSIVDPLGSVGVLRYDGVGWSRPALGMTGSVGRGLISYGSELLVLSRQTSNAGLHRVQRVAYRSGGQLDLGLFDAGLPSVVKAWRSVTVRHSALVSGQSVQVQYRLEDTGVWTPLGTSSTVGASVATFSFPSNTQGYYLGLRLLLAGTGGSSASAVVTDLTTAYAVQPSVRREWEVVALLEGVAELPMVTTDGTTESKTGAQLSAALWTAKASVQPVPFVDLDGTAYSVWVTDVREEVGELSQRRGYQTRAAVRLVQAA